MVLSERTRDGGGERSGNARQNERCVRIIDLEDLKYCVFDSVTAENARDDGGYDTLLIPLSPSTHQHPFPTRVEPFHGISLHARECDIIRSLCYTRIITVLSVCIV